MLNIERKRLVVYSFDGKDFTSLNEMKKDALLTVMAANMSNLQGQVPGIIAENLINNADSVIKVLKMKEKKQRAGKPTKVQSSGGKRGRPKGSRNAPKSDPEERPMVRTADEIRDDKA